MGNANSDINDDTSRAQRTKAKVIHGSKILMRRSSLADDSSDGSNGCKQFWGNVFTQGEGAEKWSYHFVSADGEGEEGAFLSHKHANVKLDDGSAFPDRVPFLTHSFEEETLTFRGTIHYPKTCNSTAWGGYETEDVEMKFDTGFAAILSGKVVWRDKDDQELAQNFGLCHIYVNAQLTERIVHAHHYTELTTRLKQEGATNRTIMLVARVFLEHTPQGKYIGANHSARHQAILDMVGEHTPNPTPTYNPGAPWGNVFIRKSGTSLHILANSAYISYEHRNCGNRKLDDRSPVPARVPFITHSYDEKTRTFKGSIDFVASYCSTWGGVSNCDYNMTFDSQFAVILEGSVVKEKQDGAKVTLNYREKGVHYINEALTNKIVDTDKYISMIERLKEEGASDAIILSVQNTFREDSRANLFVRHRAILDIVNRDWVELRYLDHVWKNDKEIALAALSQNGHALYYASDNLKNDQEFILSAVEIMGSALIYASDGLKNNEKVVKIAVSNDGSSLKYVSDKLKANQDIVMTAVTNDGSALEFASRGLRDDRDIVLAAVSNDGLALEHASKKLKDNKDIVMAAVSNEVATLVHASDNRKDDEDVITAAVSKDGSSLQYASKRFRSRKDTVLLAVKSHATSLKYALSGLSQDRDCLVASGLLNFKDYSQDTTTKRIILSSPLDKNGKSTPHAILFALLLRDHPYFKDFIVHFPNAWDRSTCDTEWTNFDHPCRGTMDTCQIEDVELKTGVPQERMCCWRYSFRWQLQRGKDTNGMMIQVREFDHSPSVRGHILGDGQKIETDMAKDTGIKIFEIYQGKTNNKRWAKDFEEKHINVLAEQVQSWYKAACDDMKEVDIKL